MSPAAAPAPPPRAPGPLRPLPRAPPARVLRGHSSPSGSPLGPASSPTSPGAPPFPAPVRHPPLPAPPGPASSALRSGSAPRPSQSPCISLTCSPGPSPLPPPHSPSSLARLDAPSSVARTPNPSLPFPGTLPLPASARSATLPCPSTAPFSVPSQNLAQAFRTSLPSLFPHLSPGPPLAYPIPHPPASFRPLQVSLLSVPSLQLLNFFRVLWLYSPHHKSPSCLWAPSGVPSYLSVLRPFSLAFPSVFLPRGPQATFQTALGLSGLSPPPSLQHLP